MGHTDAVTIDPKKWVEHGRSAQILAGGYVYVVAPSTTRQSRCQPDAGADAQANGRPARWRCDLPRRVGRGRLARGRRAVHDRQAFRRDRRRVLPGRRRRAGRTAGKYTRANISTTEKEPRAVEIIAHGPAGHGSVPRQSNVVAHLTRSVAKIVDWTPPLRINETTGSYFRKLAASGAARAAKRYRDVLNPDPKVSKPAADWMLENEPEHWSMLHTSLVRRFSPPAIATT